MDLLSALPKAMWARSGRGGTSRLLAVPFLFHFCQEKTVLGLSLTQPGLQHLQNPLRALHSMHQNRCARPATRRL